MDPREDLVGMVQWYSQRLAEKELAVCKLELENTRLRAELSSATDTSTSGTG